MVREDKSTWKSNYFAKLVSLLDEYPKCFIVGADNVGSKQMQVSYFVYFVIGFQRAGFVLNRYLESTSPPPHGPRSQQFLLYIPLRILVSISGEGFCGTSVLDMKFTVYAGY